MLARLGVRFRSSELTSLSKRLNEPAASRCYSLSPLISSSSTLQRTDRSTKNSKCLKSIRRQLWVTCVNDVAQNLPLHRQKGHIVDPAETPLFENKKSSPPYYDERALASMVLDKAYFYKDDEDLAQSTYARDRRAEHLGTMTVKEVFEKFVLETGSVELGLITLANAILADHGRLIEYYGDAIIPVEIILKKREMIDLSDGRELLVIKNRAVDTVPAMDQVWASTWNQTGSEEETKRILPLGLVLGPSGSGKTCFALKYLSHSFGKPEGIQDTVTIYLKVENAPIKLADATAAHELVVWIKDEVAKRINRKELPKLDMHVVVIIDEAGAKGIQWWFENYAMLSALCAQAASLATSVAVVVSGTGLTGSALSSTKDAFFFRMKPWERGDMAQILKKEIENLHLEEQETAGTVASAIFDHPKLGALGTNARSAYFLSRAVSRHSSLYARESWPYQLDQWASPIITQVVDSYISSNGISDLKRNQRRRLAASIFRALSLLKEGDANMVEFLGLENKKEISVAESLLQYNLELDNDEVKTLTGEKFAFTVTPAIAIVLYALAGIPTTLMLGWKAEEEVAALYAARHWILESMESYAATNSDSQLCGVDPLLRLEQRLNSLQLVVLQKPVQINLGRMNLPVLRPGTIMVNGDKASFADVIAPHCLIQVKRVTTKSFSEVDLCVELKKCSLLQRGDPVATDDHDNNKYYDTRLLQGLVAVWRGDLYPHKVMFKSKRRSLESGKELEPQFSKAFPENLLCDDLKNEKICYASIKKNATQVAIDNCTKLGLPSLDDINLSFILSTNAPMLQLKLSPETTIAITESNLNNEMCINPQTLNEEDQWAWENFVQKKVLGGVTIRFLFTRSLLTKA